MKAINLSDRDIMWIREALEELYHGRIKYSKNDTFRKEVENLKIDFQNLVK